MKIYDIAFAVAAVGGLYVLNWNKGMIEALISGITIGAYVVWRITRK